MNSFHSRYYARNYEAKQSAKHTATMSMYQPAGKALSCFSCEVYRDGGISAIQCVLPCNTCPRKEA